MAVSTYGKSAAIGIGTGLLIGYLAYQVQKLEKYKSPQGGTIYCIFANRVPPNPFHINMGTSFSFTADVPSDYAHLGKLFSKTYFNLKTALAAGGGTGGLCGLFNGYRMNARKEQESN